MLTKQFIKLRILLTLSFFFHHNFFLLRSPCIAEHPLWIWAKKNKLILLGNQFDLFEKKSNFVFVRLFPFPFVSCTNFLCLNFSCSSKINDFLCFFVFYSVHKSCGGCQRNKSSQVEPGYEKNIYL